MPSLAVQDEKDISIHALRKECDWFFFFVPNRLVWISIHALRKECDSLKENVTMLYAHSHFFANRYFLYQILYSFQTK